MTNHNSEIIHSNTDGTANDKAEFSDKLEYN